MYHIFIGLYELELREMVGLDKGWCGVWGLHLLNSQVMNSLYSVTLLQTNEHFFFYIIISYNFKIY